MPDTIQIVFINVKWRRQSRNGAEKLLGAKLLVAICFCRSVVRFAVSLPTSVYKWAHFSI